MDMNLPEGFKFISISVGGRSRQFVQCTRYVYSPSGKRFPCSFKKRKDSIAKTGDLTHILDHRCFNQNIDQYLQNSIKKTNDDSPQKLLIQNLAKYAGFYLLKCDITKVEF